MPVRNIGERLVKPGARVKPAYHASFSPLSAP